MNLRLLRTDIWTPGRTEHPEVETDPGGRQSGDETTGSGGRGV